jgi:hypothetical protein
MRSLEDDQHAAAGLLDQMQREMAAAVAQAAKEEEEAEAEVIKCTVVVRWQ